MNNIEDSSIQALQTEVDFYRQNQTVVEHEIKALISDNQKLSQQVGSLLKDNLKYTQKAHFIDPSKQVEELRGQITLITKERDSLHVLWQTSQKTIDALETELETYQNYSGRRDCNIKNENRRDLELKLETALSDYVDLESKFKKIYSERNALEIELKNKESENKSLVKRYKEKEEESDETKKKLIECNIEVLAEKKSHENLKCQLKLCQKECVENLKREAEAKLKVAEALQLFDVVSTQKNEAHNTIAKITEELINAKSKLANIKRDTEEEFKTELDKVRQSFNEKVSDMLEHIRNLDAELVEKGLLLNKMLRENEILHNANENHIQKEKDSINAIDPKLAIAEQRLESVFQELVASERRNIQLICEKQALALDLQKTLEDHTRECKRREWEESLLKTQCQELKQQVEHLQKSLDETHAMITKLQTMLSSRTELNNKIVTSKEEELLELNKHLENQMDLNKKWKESYVDMMEKLKKQLEALYKENRSLRLQVQLPCSSSKENSVASSR